MKKYEQENIRVIVVMREKGANKHTVVDFNDGYLYCSCSKEPVSVPSE